ncbi:MAG TPA: fumarylacetoacetate hydrolase family protein [Bacteroidota bacterium]|nr:fumarylacetoacetate hydrolase family protein [Bacteroidota bacterium]
MRLCTFEVPTLLGRQTRLGAVAASGILDLHSVCAWHLARKGEAQPYRLADVLVPPDMLKFLQGGVTSRTFAETAAADFLSIPPGPDLPIGGRGELLCFRQEQVRLLPPLPHPPSIRDFYAFEEHVKKGFEKRGEPMPKEWYEMPVYYKSAHWSVIGPEDEVTWPSFTEKFDYELELAVIIGKEGRNIPESEARGYIFGFTVMNDFSARDLQRKEMKVRLGPAKGKDFATAFGPVIVTADEIGDPYNLRMTASVNGERWSEGNSGKIYHSFEKMISFASLDETLSPGDILGSGTVGTGCGLELDRWVKPNDVIELTIEKIGTLRNKVIRR